MNCELTCAIAHSVVVYDPRYDPTKNEFYDRLFMKAPHEGEVEKPGLSIQPQEDKAPRPSNDDSRKYKK